MNHTLTLRPAFTPFTIVLMVILFMVAWPLGLLMLAYLLWGDRLSFANGTSTSSGAKRHYRSAGCFGWNASPRHESGNLAFDEYRKSELKRLEEERRRLDEERAEFEAYVQNLRRAKDQEEFDRFMAARRNGPEPTIHL
ncbi:MAG: DUF2852 domain-containing protein [Bauldia sp.]|nr:DUF2852 domain-containing protein [Bauldia sp.]